MSKEIPINKDNQHKEAQQKVAEMAEKHFQAKKAKHHDGNHEEGESKETMEANQKVTEDLTQLEKTVVELQQALVETEKKMEESRSAALHFRADIENVRRQADRDIANAHKYSVEKFALALLPILDSLEHGIAAILQDQAAHTADPKYQALCEGNRMTLKMFIDMLLKFNIAIIDPVGEKFDPAWHEAIAMQPSTEVEPGTVLTVVQKGYRLHDRLLRPARVIVAKE